MSEIRSHQQRPVVEELRELRDIARREHGTKARSTLQIEACLQDEERAAKDGGRASAHTQGPRKRRP